MARVIGFHACKRPFAEALVRGDISLAEWKPSANRYDWLGKGIYFWERNKRRAKEWAAHNVKGEAAVIQAEIELGFCLDLADYEYLHQIRATYDRLVSEYEAAGRKLPLNRNLKLRNLDRLVIDTFVEDMEHSVAEPVSFDTVCSPFEEGDPLFPGSLIRTQSHVQIAVRNSQMIKAIKLIQ
jgi:hypothetical protein